MIGNGTGRDGEVLPKNRLTRKALGSENFALPRDADPAHPKSPIGAVQQRYKPQVDRLLDLRHDSRLDQLEQAFAVLSKRMTIAVEAA
jgi:hypothetical protein